MSSVKVQPSEAEVNAIKQQLKLLGHTLPTDVIVKFLQDNSGLLTAYQQPELSTESSRDQSNNYTLADATRRQQLAEVKPEFVNSRATQPAAQAVPQLDVTWATAASSQHLRRGRPAQVPCSTPSCAITTAGCYLLARPRRSNDILYFRVCLAQVRQHKMMAAVQRLQKLKWLAQSGRMDAIKAFAPETPCTTMCSCST